MPLTNAGRDNVIVPAIVGAAYTPLNNANAHLGLGDSATAFVNTQTDLVGTNKFRRPMDATYPTVATNVITFRATFGTTEANYAVAEWGLFNALSGGTMLSRRVEALGTKTSAATWQVTATLTLTV